MVSREDSFSFESVWEGSYNLNFGNYQSSNRGLYSMEYFAYFGATVTNVVLMLNLLISILGDSYERFQLEQSVINVIEKAKISIELQSLMFWAKKYSDLEYIRLCNFAFNDARGQDWEGRIIAVDRIIEKHFREIKEGSRKMESSVKKSNMLVQAKVIEVEAGIKESKQMFEENIGFIQNRIDLIEDKITGIGDKMEASIQSLESQVESRFISMESMMEVKIQMNHEIETAQIGKIHEKLEAILQLLSK